MVDFPNQGDRVECWVFSVYEPTADCVMLAHRCEGHATSLERMRPDGEGWFRLEMRLPRGYHRFHYLAEVDGTFLNCGTGSLAYVRLGRAEPDPAPLKVRTAPGQVFDSDEIAVGERVVA